MASEQAQLAEQREAARRRDERNRQTRLRNASAEKKRASEELRKAQERVRATKPGTPSRLDAERRVLDAKRRINEADQTIRQNSGATSTPAVSTPAAAAVTTSDREGRVGLAKDQSAAAASGGGMDVRAIQQRLRDNGYNIAVDGVWGPKSAAAWTDFSKRGGSMTQTPSETSGVTPASGGGGGAAATSPAAAGIVAPAAPPTSIEEDYPALAPFLQIPEIGALLRQAKAEGWPPEKLQARVQATEWWKSTPPTARAFMGLEAFDPMAAKQKITAQRDDLKKLNGQYLIDMSDQALDMYARQVASGGSDVAAYQKMIVEQAKGKFPGIAASLDQGLTVRQLADPYVQTAARELELSPDAIDLNDPKWNRALQSFDESGKPRTMTLYEWQKTLRTDKSYGYDRTSGARKTAAEMATTLGQLFGKVG